MKSWIYTDVITYHDDKPIIHDRQLKQRHWIKEWQNSLTNWSGELREKVLQISRNSVNFSAANTILHDLRREHNQKDGQRTIQNDVIMDYSLPRYNL